MLEEVYKFLARGGFLMIPIILCLLVALTIFIERIWFLNRRRVLPREFRKLIWKMVRGGNIPEASVVCQQNGSPMARIVASALKQAPKGRAAIKEAVQETGHLEMAVLERYVGVLSTIASVAPLLGLLGTVTGMVNVFQKVTVHIVDVEQRTQILASGIWEALITTVAGLTVAIPTYIAYRILEGRVDRLSLEMEEDTLELIDMLAEGPPEPAVQAEGAAPVPEVINELP